MNLKIFIKNKRTNKREVIHSLTKKVIKELKLIEN